MRTELITSAPAEVKSGPENAPKRGGKSFLGGCSAGFECSLGCLSRTSWRESPKKNPLPREAEILHSFTSALNRKGSGGSVVILWLSKTGRIY